MNVSAKTALRISMALTIVGFALLVWKSWIVALGVFLILWSSSIGNDIRAQQRAIMQNFNRKPK